MAGDSDFQGTDTDPRGKDAKTGSVKKKGPDPGKTTNVDPAGVSPAVPGKRTNTDGMAADGAAQGGEHGTPGKSTQVDAHEGKDGKDKDGNDAIAKVGPGGGAAKTVDADHNGAAVDGKQLAAVTGKAPPSGESKVKEPVAKNTVAPKGDAADGAAKDGKEGAGPLHLAKPAAPVQAIDPGAPATMPAFTMPAPRANKNLSDKWLNETGRTLEQHHEQIERALQEVQAEATAKQAELLQIADAEITKVTGEISAKVQTFNTGLVGPGKQRVEAAYGGLGKGFETAEQKALADIAKQKAAGKAAIETAKKNSGDGISKKLQAAKAVVGQTIQKNVPPAANAIKKWAAGIPGWVKAAKDLTKAASETAGKQFDPKKGGTGSLDAGYIALSEDVKKNLVTKAGDRLAKQYEGQLLGWSKDTDRKADEMVRKALDESKVELDAALDTADAAAKQGFQDAIKNATTSLDTSETTAKKSVTDARTSGIKRFESEKKEAVEAADKAGKELSDNTSGAGTELTDRIKKKANDDSKNYAALVADLQAKFKSPTPMQFEQAKPKIDAAKQQLLKLHDSQKGELNTLVTEGKNALVGTLTRQQEIYERAIADRETKAKKCETDVIKEIGAGVTAMNASLAGMGKSFTEITDRESKRIDQMVTQFNQNADTATKEFGNKISVQLDTMRKGLDEKLKADLEPATIGQTAIGPAQAEIAAKKKQLDTDTGGLRSAMDGWGTDEGKIYAILRKCSYGEITYLEASYNAHYPQRASGGLNPLRADFKDELSGSDLQIVMSYLNHDRATAIKLELADSKGFFNDDEKRIQDVLRGCSEEEITHLNTNPDAKKVVESVKSALGGADLDMMTTLLDQSMDRDDRKIKTDAINLFQTMDGLGTDEAQMKKILEECKTEEERAKLRAQFNQYAKSKGWDGGTGTEDNDALTIAIKDDIGTGLFGNNKGEQNQVLALAATKRDENDIKAAKMVDAGDGLGTNNDQLFESLDDEEYAKQWAAADPAKRKELEEARRKLMDEKVAKMSGGKWDTAQGLIDDEMSKSKITYQEFIDRKRENGTPLTADEIAGAKNGNNLAWMVAQRKLQAGRAEPDLMLAYACWGVAGTDEDTIKKVLGPEPKSIAEVNELNATFQRHWGRALISHNELQDMQRGEPTGLLHDELSGKDWFSVRVLLMGKPETAEQLKYVSDARAKFNKGGVLSNALMTVGEAVGYTEAKSTAEATEARFNKEYQEKFGKNPTAKLGTADSKELEQLAEYLSQDYEAYSAALNSLVDGVVTALEIIGGVIITVATAGTASPVLAAVISNLVLSAGTITFKYAALGDQYGAAELANDVVKAAGSAAFAGLGEWKAFKTMAQNVGNKAAGGVQKLTQLADQAATKAGMKFVGNGVLEMGPKSTERLSKMVAAATRSVISSTGQEIYNTITDEKTYSRKLGDVLFGEDSIGARILKNIPKNVADSMVSQWINDAAGTSNKNNMGHSTGPKSNALTAAISEIAGTSAGFFCYVDNYQDAEHFWVALLKANARGVISSTFQGYAMHKTRAKKLGRDFITGAMKAEGLETMLHSMDAHEIEQLAKFVAQYAPEKAAGLPDGFKKYLPQQPATTPATTTTDQTTQAKPPSKPPTPPRSPPSGGAGGVVGGQEQDMDELTEPVTPKPAVKAATPVVPAAPDEEQEQQKPAVVKPKPKPSITDQQQEQQEQAKPAARPKDDGEVVAEAERLKQPQKPATPTATVTDEEEQKPAVAPKAKPTKVPLTPEQEAEQKKIARSQREEEQQDKQHSGVDVHSHFLGNVEPKTFRKVIEESGGAPLKKSDPNGATASEKIGDTTSWEPVLREIVGLQKQKGFAHTYETDAEGAHVKDPKTGLPRIQTRGVTGDAIAQAQTALLEIEQLKQQMLNPRLSDGDREKLKGAIYRTARSAAEKSLRASDETDFNSSYEVRDELIKKFYGEKDRTEVLAKAGLEADTPFAKAADTYRKYYAEAGREDVVATIDHAKRAQAQLAADDEVKKSGKPGLSQDERKQLQIPIDAVHQQFAYDKFAKDTLLTLIRDGVTYTEQSNSSKKLGERFDADQIDHIKKQLMIEHPDLAPKIEAFQVKHLTMLNTASFGTRDGADTGDLPAKAKGTRANANTPEAKAAEEGQFKADVRKAVEQTKRKDVVGVDIAGAENFTFDEVGKQRFAHLYNALFAAAVERGQPIVLRPHVGEGANDVMVGKHGARDMDRQMVDGQLSHYKRAKDNLDALLGTLEDIAANKGKGGKLPPEVIVRFGHATHATPEQAKRMAQLGILAEVNLTSNHETGAVAQKKPASNTEDGQRDQETTFPKKNISQARGGKLEDHSLANLILNDVPILLSTDGHSVMTTTMGREFQRANGVIDKILTNKQTLPLTLDQARALKVPDKLLKPDADGVVHVKLKDIQDEAGAAEITAKFQAARQKFYDAANDYYDRRPKQEEDGEPAGPDGRGIKDPGAPRSTSDKNIRRAESEEEHEDANKLRTSNAIVKGRFQEAVDGVELVGPPKGKTVLKQGAGDALISLPIEAIPATSDYETALAAVRKNGIPRWAALTEKERMHETAYANRMEKDLPNQVRKFIGMSVTDDPNTFQFEVDKAKQLYARYGQGGDVSKVTNDQAETRATANHALHPTAVALARLAFLKRLDEMQAMAPDDPYRNVFVTNGGCGAGKGSLFGLAGEAMPGKKFGAVWDAAGEGDASENAWILAAAAKRGIKVTYGFAENDAASNYKGVLDRAVSTGRIVDPVTYARSYVKGGEAMKEFLNSKEYQDALAAGNVEAIGLNIPELRAEKDRHTNATKAGEQSTLDKNAGKLGNNGYITGADIKTKVDEVTVSFEAAKIFAEWVEKKRIEWKDDPQKLQQLEWFIEGGATNTAKFDAPRRGG